MEPKVDDDVVSYRLCDRRNTFVTTRNHKALLLSVGHLYRDGRWTGEDDDFYTYQVYEPRSFGKQGHMTQPLYDFAIDTSVFPGPILPATFYPTICRGYSQPGWAEEVPLPPVEDPEFSDYVLDLNDQGTTWISRNRPGNPLIQFGQFLGELHQLPSIPLLHTIGQSFLKRAGKEYLNVEFGWRPFIKDLIDVFSFESRFTSAYKRLVRDNGVSIRKRSKKVVVEDEPEVICEGTMTVPFGRLNDVSLGGHSSLDGFFFIGPMGPDDLDFHELSGTCHYKYTKTVTSTTWNCGTFRYYVPDIGSVRFAERARRVLAGADFTPSFLYQVMPWSWLIDWFSNVGKILSNATKNAVDDESLTNAYSMKTIKVVHKVVISTQWDHLHSTLVDVPAGSDKVEYSRAEITKLRHQSSPFGFGIPSSSFTARQWAILAALAVSRK